MVRRFQARPPPGGADGPCAPPAAVARICTISSRPKPPLTHKMVVSHDKSPLWPSTTRIRWRRAAGPRLPSVSAPPLELIKPRARPPLTVVAQAWTSSACPRSSLRVAGSGSARMWRRHQRCLVTSCHGEMSRHIARHKTGTAAGPSHPSIRLSLNICDQARS